MATLPDDLADTAKATAREILGAPSLLSLFASKQQKTLGILSEGVRHPDASLIQSYVEEVITAHTGPPWSPQALETAIYKGPHALACTLDMDTFVWEEM